MVDSHICAYGYGMQYFQTDGDDESDDEGGGAVADTKRPELAGVVQQLQKTRADFEHHEDYVVVYLKVDIFSLCVTTVSSLNKVLV